MAKIASGNVEVYIRQLLSEALDNDVDLRNRSKDEELLKYDDFKLTNRKLSEKSKDN